MVKVEQVNFTFTKYDNHRVINVSTTHKVYNDEYKNSFYHIPIFLLDIDLETKDLTKDLDYVLNNGLEVLSEIILDENDLRSFNYGEYREQYHFGLKVEINREHNALYFTFSVINDKNKERHWILDLDTMNIISYNRYMFGKPKWEVLYEGEYIVK